MTTQQAQIALGYGVACRKAELEAFERRMRSGPERWFTAQEWEAELERWLEEGQP